ncbi:hypothetical protein GCM10023165_12050 [Variovorax defluvii]|uniref:DhaL domain-containing protein n=1 Tax=Variovorax defluvii TaxID=913761 RepID=A0ABP8H858_9BURK
MDHRLALDHCAHLPGVADQLHVHRGDLQPPLGHRLDEAGRLQPGHQLADRGQGHFQELHQLAPPGIGSLTRAELAAMLIEVVTSLSSRGGATLGDKTVLDGRHAVATALAASPDGADARRVARDASLAALDAFRYKPNRIGRARMFADKTIGLDDPGMVALHRMIESL